MMNCHHCSASFDWSHQRVRAAVLLAPAEFVDVASAYDWYGLTGCKIGGCNQGQRMVVQVQGIQGYEYCGHEGSCLASSQDGVDEGAERRG
jgi:hypothetical protein